MDPRYFQISVLSTLLLYGVFALNFDVAWPCAAVLVGTALATQWIGTRLSAAGRFDPRSAFISSLSLCLLFRCGSLWLAALASAISVGSKFLIRVRGKHVFNPTNFGIAVLVACSAESWISPGQWGSELTFVAFAVCAGGLVLNRAARVDITAAFLCFHAALLFYRATWLGDPLTIPLHQLSSGALVLFAFFMISDPKATPDRRAGRILFAALVALVAYYIRFKLFNPNALMYALVLVSPITPLIDWVLPGPRYRWDAPRGERREPFRALILSPQGATMFKKHLAGGVAALLLALIPPQEARAFCGFYVAKAGSDLFNESSKVVIVRDGDRTVMTMANDYKGDPKEFAIVIPVPTSITRDQIHVANAALIDHLDAYSAPRLVEYYDEDPCELRMLKGAMLDRAVPAPAGAAAERAKSLGVTIEAQYTVGEYDILILSAEQGAGLETWLNEEGYKVPGGASDILGSYIKQKMRFFVAKVNLQEKQKLGFSFLRPLQVAYESPKFMLPIRLGMINANGPQDLFVFALTKNGRVETTNYRTVKLPEGMDVPLYVKDEFTDFYKAMFSTQVKEQESRAVFTEYAWDMSWCDPCAAQPLSNSELRELGVFWLEDAPPQPRQPWMGGSPVNVFLTRLHVRYDLAHFPEDLQFQQTGDRQNFQARYVLRHPWTGSSTCSEADAYRKGLQTRQGEEVRTLARLTGWSEDDIAKKAKVSFSSGGAGSGEEWWKKVWPKS